MVYSSLTYNPNFVYALAFTLINIAYRIANLDNFSFITEFNLL